MKKIYSLAIATFFSVSGFAQTKPENSPVTLTFNAKGDSMTISVDVSKQCMGTLGTEFVDGEDMYMHTGVGLAKVFENAAGSTSKWQYVVESGAGGTPNVVAQLQYAGGGIYESKIHPRNFYGVATTDTIFRFCFVFNNGTWDKKVEALIKDWETDPTKADWCGDIYVEPASPLASVSEIKNIAIQKIYPNPVSEVMNISYSVNKTGQFTISIYNVLGEEVKTILNEVQGPGKYQLQWNLESNTGRTVPNGLYFYKVTTNGNPVYSRKITVLK